VDEIVKETKWKAKTGTLTIPARTAAVLVDDQKATGTAKVAGSTSVAPTVGLDAGSVQVGSTLAVSGTGFEPGELVQVWLHSTPRLLQAQPAGADGAVAFEVAIPQGTETDGHHVRLVGVASGADALTPLTVVGPLGLTATQGALAVLLGLSALAAGLVIAWPHLRRGRQALAPARVSAD
jgi:hypothetical protein